MTEELSRDQASRAVSHSLLCQVPGT